MANGQRKLLSFFRPGHFSLSIPPFPALKSLAGCFVGRRDVGSILCVRGIRVFTRTRLECRNRLAQIWLHVFPLVQKSRVKEGTRIKKVSMCEAAEKEEKDDPIHYPPPPPVLIGRQPTSLFNCHHLPPLPPPRPPPPAAQEQSPISFPLSLFLSHTKRREGIFRRSHLFLLRYFFSRLDLVIENPFLTLSSLKKPERRAGGECRHAAGSGQIKIEIPPFFRGGENKSAAVISCHP